MNRMIPSTSLSVFFGTTVCLLALSQSGSAQQNPLPKSIQSLVPVGKIKVDVLQAYTPARLAQVLSKMESTARKQPELYRELMTQQRPPCTFPPYDARLGISKAEYEVLTTLKPYMKKIKEATLTIKVQGAVRIFDGGKDLPELIGLQIDLSRGTVKTPYGVLSEYHSIQPKQQIMGPWEGVAWTEDTVGVVGRLPNQIETGYVIDVGLGKLKESGRGLFFYRAQKIENRTLQPKALTTIVYDIKPAQKD